MTSSLFGASVERREDDRLLRGAGTFVDDVPGETLHVAFVRSPHAHARITGIHTAAALEVPGVAGVFTYDDLAGTALAEPLPISQPHPAITQPRTPYALARDEVHHTGQPVVMVVAADRYVAEDAVAAVRVDYEPLPVAIDLARSARGEEGPAHRDMDGNVYASVAEEVGDVDAALAAAPHVFEYDFTFERAAGTPMECRGVRADYDLAAGRLRVWDSTQGPMMIAGQLARLLHLDPENVEVIAPDVGGGFGTKAFNVYPEEALVPWAAQQLGRPVKWIEDRGEHFVASNHQRSQRTHVTVAADRDGHLLALDVRFLHDGGAFCQFGLILPMITAAELSGQYRIPHLRYAFQSVYTNTTQTSPYRGAGQVYANLVTERVLDKVAKELGIDRAEVRRRNFIPPDAFPYEVGVSFPHGYRTVYDSGQYGRQFEELLKAIGYDGFEAERRAAAKQGRRIGLGIACYVEVGGTGPYEGAKINVLPDGSVTVAAGSSDTGQGHATTFAQLVAGELGVPLERVRVVTGDSRRLQYGIGTWASRTAAVGGSAVAGAAAGVAAKAKALAARMLEVDPDDLELADGVVRAKGAPQVAVPLRDLAVAARFMPPADGDAPGLTVTHHFAPRMTIFSSGAHAAVVEIDPDTYDLRILRYAVVHDCGKVINPLLVKGQILGGLAHGIADAFYERRHYDAQGRLLNASLMDYLVPFAAEIPEAELRHLETPSPTNPLGVKGAGEGGTIPVPAAIASALEDALGVAIDAMPQSPLTLYELMRERDHAQPMRP